MAAAIHSQRRNFRRIEQPPMALGQFAQGQGPDPDSHQAQCRQPVNFEHAAYLTISSFVERNFQPGMALAGAQATHRFEIQALAINETPGRIQPL